MNPPIALQEKYTGCLLGLACGDAVGTTLEFLDRGTFTPIEDMVGGGPFQLQAGQWTDDTSMALCLGYSLLTQKTFDPVDQMNRYCNWYHYGYMSSTGQCFDIGNTVATALSRYLQTKDPYAGSTHPRSAGNGAIMRLAPIPMFYALNQELTLKYSAESSRTTHAAEEAIECARLFGQLIRLALLGFDKNDILFHHHYVAHAPNVIPLAQGDYVLKPEQHIHGTGYVVHSLEAALWCFAHTHSFKDAVLKAANLGDDADTTAAIVGQLAGAYYGVSDIPVSWLNKLSMKQEIEDLAKDLLRYRCVDNK